MCHSFKYFKVLYMYMPSVPFDIIAQSYFLMSCTVFAYAKNVREFNFVLVKIVLVQWLADKCDWIDTGSNTSQ